MLREGKNIFLARPRQLARPWLSYPTIITADPSALFIFTTQSRKFAFTNILASHFEILTRNSVNAGLISDPVGTGFPGLNQYYVRIYDTMQ